LLAAFGTRLLRFGAGLLPIGTRLPLGTTPSRLLLPPSRAGLTSLTALRTSFLTTLLSFSAALLSFRTGASFGAWRASARSAALIFDGAAATLALLELLQLSLHEFPLLRVHLRPHRIVAAVRAALPTVRMRFLAGWTYDALWKGHSESARIVHFRP
jgi:hypothetical protein